MKYFYEGLMDGMRKSEALSYAKREFLNKHSDNITSHPYYWAGFYVLGNDEPILRSYFFSSNNLIKLTVIAVTMFMMTLLVLFVNKPRLLR